jgi:hypothetical protein
MWWLLFWSTANHPPYYTFLHHKKLHAALLPKELQNTKCENISFKQFHVSTINHAFMHYEIKEICTWITILSLIFWNKLFWGQITHLYLQCRNFSFPSYFKTPETKASFSLPPPPSTTHKWTGQDVDLSRF